MGTPTQQTWPEGMKLAGQMKFSFPHFSATPLQKLIPNASPEAIDLMTAMCQWDPARRPSAVQALQHPFFQVYCYAELALLLSPGRSPGQLIFRGHQPDCYGCAIT